MHASWGGRQRYMKKKRRRAIPGDGGTEEWIRGGRERVGSPNLIVLFPSELEIESQYVHFLSLHRGIFSSRVFLLASVTLCVLPQFRAFYYCYHVIYNQITNRIGILKHRVESRKKEARCSGQRARKVLTSRHI